MASINYLIEKLFYVHQFHFFNNLLILGINSSTKLGAYAIGTSAVQTRFTESYIKGVSLNIKCNVRR